MISLSKTDIEALTYLIRNFSEKLTVRQLAGKLEVTSAGLHQGLKKMEEFKLVRSIKLGTGLFYEINWGNEASCHLAAFCLALNPAPFATNTMVLVKGKRGISLGTVSIDTYDITPMTKQALLGKLRNRDGDVLDLIRTGNVTEGKILVELIKEAAPRW